MASNTSHRFNISLWSIEHPHVVIAFYVAVVLLSILALLFYMPRRMMPYVESPMIGIVSMMPGLSAEEMETYISKPIEERMVAIKNVRFIRSSSQDGQSIVSLEFPYGTNMQRTLVDVQTLMNVVQADLPVTGANLKPSWVLPIDPLNIPVLTLSVTGDQRWTPLQLRQLADNEIINRLKTVPNVYTASTYGGQKRQLQVVVDRNRLAAYNLSILDVRKALDDYNVTRPAGTLTSGTEESIVRINTRALQGSDVENYVIKALPGGQVVYVRNVAQVLDTAQEQRSSYHFVNQGKVQEAIAVNVLQNPGASSPQVIQDTTKVLKQLESDYPGIHFEVAYDNAHFVNILTENMVEELGMAILLTGIAVFLFLGNWRATIISLITIPVSLAIAILGMILLGLTLNSSTLIGLLLSIGRLVDDSIIDIHAVEKHLRLGKDPKTATVDGITEVRLAVAASTLMLILALAPLLFTGGIVEQMFVGLVWPIILGLLASFLVSLTLTALLASRFLKPHEPIEEASEAHVQRKRPWIYRRIVDPFQRFLDRLENRYGGLVGWSLDNRFTVVAIALAAVIIGTGFYNFIGSEMMPLADVGQAYGVLETKPGASFARTQQIVTEVEKLMAQQPEIEKVSTELGVESGPAFSGTGAVYFTGYAMGQVNGASMMITLKDKSDRSRTIWQVVDSVQQQAMERFPKEIRRFQIKEMGSDVMASSQAPISILIYGKDLEILDKLGQQVADLASKIPGLVQVATDWTIGLPAKELTIDFRKAQELGLTPQMISDQLYYALRGGFTTEYFRSPNIRQNTILVRYREDQRRNNNQDIEQVYLTNDQGQSVPLKSIATITDRKAPTVVTHDGLRRVITVLGYYRLNGPPSMDLTMDVLQKAVSEINWPPGYGLEIRGDMTQMMDSFRRLLLGLQLAIILIFLVLVAQFRGAIQPFQMILSLPLELTGVFMGLFFMGQAFSTVSIMAVIILTGMDITTAILMIDMMDLRRKEGIPREKAIRMGAVERLRPILMTSIITIIVMLPVSISPRTGMDAYAPLGTVIVWGLFAGTVLSLLVIPVMHSLIDDAALWIGQKANRFKNRKQLGEAES
ncbi:MAG: efflux RND transporter permease subunit [Cyanobacteria bacterium]|nr:efflux RND transporter permease subunit [Cyanobacteriota bacterium]